KSFSSFNALGESDVRKYEDLIRLMFFTQFFLERVAITQIRADSEDFAFDMFESLNSTGEPLTAFETFRPKIIIQDQEGSETDNHAIADDIASILDSKTIDEKKRRTDNFIIAFAVAEIGHKLPKKLYMQRSFLRESFNNTPNEDRQDFINHMHHVAKFMRHFWFTEDITKENSRSFGLKCELSLGKDALMCLQYLRDVNHTVTIPILSRYYTKIIMTSEEDQMETLFHEFELAIKSVTAFSILWRAFVGGTSGIDTVYRDLVAGKLKIVGDLVFSRRIKKDRTEINTKVPSISELKKAFRDILREHKQMRISSRETWIKRASDELKYIKQKEVNKFIILAAFHFSQTNKNESGMLKRASNNRGGQETLLIDMWNDVDFSLEHIAPQSDQHWHGSDIYNSAVTVHKLGNLVFLNQSINNTLTNRSWKEKKQIFDLLSTQDDEDFRKKSEDLNITVNIEKLARYGFLPHLSSLTLVESWNKIMIESRTENLLSLAWDTIYPWLEDN
ncbi:MAG: DUF1524 domain-containing protein, partial [Proteobacteria bacterium]|nr:DUF1524 domain-containing protein [Pseudomonadota bacterium]